LAQPLMQQSPAGGSSGGGPFPSIEGKSEAPLEEEEEANLLSNEEIGNLPTLPGNSSHLVTRGVGQWVELTRKEKRDQIKPN